jgi:hypothetical protein
MTYQEKLKDPRWQKMRLEILERDQFMCRHCQDDKNTLHVHHRYYEKGKDPWEYDERSLVTLCAGCHKAEEEQRNAQWGLMEKSMRRAGFSEGQILDIAASFCFHVFKYPEEVVAEMIRIVFQRDELARKFEAIYFDYLKEKNGKSTA